jgi:polysaccharide export outer membrane protein
VNSTHYFIPGTKEKLLALLCTCIFFASCVSSKRLTEKAIYFKNISDSALQKAAIQYEPQIQKGDILYIGVITPNEKSAQLFNQPNFYAGSNVITGSSTSTTSGPTQGYLVNEKGSIVFPYLGQMHVAGMTKQSLADTITNKIRQYIDSAIVNVRLLNYRVTVLGEVARPGTFSIPSERVSVLDALGLAGDLTIYGRRDNVRIIRNTGEKMQSATLDLNEGNIFSSPYFYLQPNDVLYVEMNNRKIPNADQTNIRNVSIALGIISAIGVVVSAINVLNN